jgi:hypothetical protein
MCDVINDFQIFNIDLGIHTPMSGLTRIKGTVRKGEIRIMPPALIPARDQEG